MFLKKVFIDGSSGTTGLRIYERLKSRDDVELIILPGTLRKDDNAKKEAYRKADIIFLCLPDSESIRAVNLCDNENAVIIDTSTAHRTSENWVYGFAELKNKRDEIRRFKRIANPGCHASGFIALVSPLVEEGLVDKSQHISCFSITGYSGGGKNMIKEYGDNPDNLLSPRLYSLGQEHKHLAEMTKISKLENKPIFNPIVSSYYSGMAVVIPFFKRNLKISKNANQIEYLSSFYSSYYDKEKIVHFEKSIDVNGFIASSVMSGRDDMILSVYGNDERITLVALFDNLGKGASGAAIQNMNIILGTDEYKGLVLG